MLFLGGVFCGVGIPVGDIGRVIFIWGARGAVCSSGCCFTDSTDLCRLKIFGVSTWGGGGICDGSMKKVRIFGRAKKYSPTKPRMIAKISDI